MERDTDTGQTWSSRFSLVGVGAAVGVALAVLGAVLLSVSFTSTRSSQSKTGTEVVIALWRDATATEARAISQALSAAPDVRSFRFVGSPRAESLLPCHLPGCGPGGSTVIGVPQDTIRSFRIVPTNVESIPELVARFRGDPGVLTVASART